MDDIQSQITELITQSRRLHHGVKTKVELLKQAVDMADTHQLLDLQFSSRKELINEGMFSGYGELSIAAFAWCLATSDNSPARFPIHALLWDFKWIVGVAPMFPTIAREQIESMVTEMEQRYKQTGCSQRAVHTAKARACLLMGQVDKAVEMLKTAERNQRDYYADCSACELDLHVEGLLASSHFELGLKKAAPIMNGVRSCAEIPHLTLANIIIPLVILNRKKEAQKHHEKGYRLISKNRAYVTQIAKHMRYCMHTGQRDRAVRMFQDHFAWAIETAEALNQLNFFMVSCALLEKILDDTIEIALTLPKTFPLYREDSIYQTESLRAWLTEKTRDLAKQFDNRNQNDFYTTSFEKRHDQVYF